jgi:hypothetical protein
MTNQEYDELRQSVENWQNKKRAKQDFGMSAPFILIVFGILFIYVFSIKDTASENSNSNSTTTENIATNSKYQSYNYYGNNVTEYLETKADGSVFYSTSTRPNQIRMIVTAGDKDGYFECFIEFPKGTGDGQRYGINKSGGNLMVVIPYTDAKPQVYTPIK